MKNLKKFNEDFLNESKEPLTDDFTGPVITVDGKKIKTTWVVTHTGDVHAKGATWELVVDDKKSQSELKKLGVKFEAPHTWLYSWTVKTNGVKDMTTVRDLDVLKKEMTKDQFVAFAKKHHGGSTFESLNEAKQEGTWYGVFAVGIAKTNFRVGPDQFWVVADSEEEAEKKLKKYAGSKDSYMKKIEKVTQVNNYGPASKMSKKEYDSAIK